MKIERDDIFWLGHVVQHEPVEPMIFNDSENLRGYHELTLDDEDTRYRDNSEDDE